MIKTRERKCDSGSCAVAEGWGWSLRGSPCWFQPEASRLPARGARWDRAGREGRVTRGCDSGTPGAKGERAGAKALRRPQCQPQRECC